MTIRPFANRAPISPIANPPIRLPIPIPVSRKPYAACQPNPELLNVSLDEARGQGDRQMPTLNWPTAPWSVFASRTVSCRRNCQPAIELGEEAGVVASRRSAAGPRTVPGDDDRGEQARRREVGRAVEPERERDGAAEERDEQPGQRVADDVGDRLADPQRRVRAQQVLAPGRCAGRIATRAGRKKTEMVVTRKISG